MAYGVHDVIPAGVFFEEIMDETRKHAAVLSAPHPFSLINELRENAKKCDMIEVFNSNNVDILSNMRAAQFALDNEMIPFAGSDSHLIHSWTVC